MAKKTLWFTHDFYSRNDPKIQKLNRKMGMEGIGLFWCIIEMMHEQDGYLLLADCDDYAFALHSDSERIKSVINDFGLFKQNDTKFWSEAAISRIVERREKSQKATESANAKWDSERKKELFDANAMRTHSETDANAMLIQYNTIQKITEENSKKDLKSSGVGHAAAAAPTPKNKFSQEKVLAEEKKFYDTLAEFLPHYDKKMIRAFYDYWRERTKSGARMRFQLEKTWDVSLRLQKWRSTDDKWSGNKKIEKTDSPTKIVKDGATLLAETEARQRENAKKYLVSDVPPTD